MPVMRCTRDGEQGWKYGEGGHCYLASEEGGDNKAKQKAYLQGVAIEGGKLPENMAELREVPLLKRGIYNGFQINDLSKVVSDTATAMPYLIDGIFEGMYQGQREALNAEPIPGFINLNHDTIAPEKLKEWSQGVSMELDTRLINGEEWVIGNFTNVDRELAQLLSVGFPGRSVEILPDFQNPETGEIYPIVLRSVAFLDPRTEPAVPQTPGYSVKLSRPDQGVITVRMDVPNINNNTEENNDMEEKAQDVVKLAHNEEIIKLKARIDAFEGENKTLRDAVTNMKEHNDELAKHVQAYKEQAHQAGVEKFQAQLERDFNVTPAGLEIIMPIIGARDGIVKLADNEKPVQEATQAAILELVRLAKKDALFLPDASKALPTGKQDTKSLTIEQQREAAIKAVIKLAKEEGKTLNYGDAFSIAAKQPETKALFNPLSGFGEGGK